MTATASGFESDAVLTYSVSPALPAGLTLSTTTGEITGAPTTVSASSVKVTVTVSAGTGTERQTATEDIIFPAVDEGGSGTYEMRLSTQPSDEVTVAITGMSSTDVTVDQTALTFKATNWYTAQTVRVTAGADADGTDDTVTLIHTASGGDYDDVTGRVTVTVDDDTFSAPTIAYILLLGAPNTYYRAKQTITVQVRHDDDGDARRRLWRGELARGGCACLKRRRGWVPRAGRGVGRGGGIARCGHPLRIAPGVGAARAVGRGGHRSGHDDAHLDWSMVAAGLRGELPPRGAPGLTLALVSDALWAQTDSARVAAVGSGSSLAGSESEVTRLRLGLEGRWAVSLEAGGSVAPRVEAGVRHDGGDAGSGIGVELGGGVTWEVPRLGLSLDLAGRTLLAHESDGRRERGLSATVGYDARPGSERGLSLTLRQETGGRSEGGLDALFAPESLDGGLGAAEVPSRWTAEAAYGLPVFGGRFTASPTVGVGLSGPAHEDSLGWRLAPAASPSGLSLGVKATRRQSDDTAPAHGIKLEVRAHW